MSKRLPLLILLTALGASPARALPKGGHVKASLVSEIKNIQAGHPFWVAVRLEMEDGWHTYWKNAGESGAPTTVTWELPRGFEAGPLQWPAPKKIAVPPVVSYGYENEVLLLTQITPPDFVNAPGPVTLTAHINWLECEVVCIPGQADATLTLPLDSLPPAVDDVWLQRFDETRLRTPIMSSDWKVEASQTPKGYRVQLTPMPHTPVAIADLNFFAEDPAVIDYAAPQTLTNVGSRYTLDLVRSEASTAPVHELRGVLVNSAGWRGPSSEPALAIDVPVSMVAASKPTDSGFALALLFAFIGGLILNLMPCVLPVLSIKVLGYIEHARQGRATAFRHGITFAAGVIVSFWVLSGALLILRAGGHQLGWGFQLQSPGFVGFLAVLFFILGLSLFGVIEIGTSLIEFADLTRGRKGYVESFLSGVLATTVATPCTAPFMGSALGYALTIPAAQAVAIFTSLGVGMAAPYLFFSAHPTLVRVLPKPGPWMNTFKKIMGSFMMATVLWLLWVLGTQLAILKPHNVADAQRNLPPWEPYSIETVEKQREQGRIVFVDFTAAWCLTCQVNERVTLHSNDVVKMFRDKNIALVRADWTRQDPEITSALRSFGRSGVPFYVIYPSDPAAPPIPLPELITPKIVTDALSKVH